MKENPAANPGKAMQVQIRIRIGIRNLSIPGVLVVVSDLIRVIWSDPNTFYEKECALAVNQQYTLTCKSSNENGWNSNFLIVENKAYCENFTTGPEEVHNVTLLGKKIFLVIKKHRTLVN